MKIKFSKSEWEAMGKKVDVAKKISVATATSAITPEIQSRLDNMDMDEIRSTLGNWGIDVPRGSNEEVMRKTLSDAVAAGTIPGYVLPR